MPLRRLAAKKNTTELNQGWYIAQSNHYENPKCLKRCCLATAVREIKRKLRWRIRKKNPYSSHKIKSKLVNCPELFIQLKWKKRWKGRKKTALRLRQEDLGLVQSLERPFTSLIWIWPFLNYSPPNALATWRIFPDLWPFWLGLMDVQWASNVFSSPLTALHKRSYQRGSVLLMS